MTLTEFIEHLKRVDDPDSRVKFDMDKTAACRKSTHRSCGSACCIGGHASLILNNYLDDPELALASLTGIPLPDAKKICWPNSNGEVNPYTASLSQAVDLLEHYAKTGEVDWPRAMEDEE